MTAKELVNGRPQQTALLLIDVINDFGFPDAEELLPPALEMAEVLSGLSATCLSAGVPVIYVNDNFGDWKMTFEELVRHCLNVSMAKSLIELLKPSDDAYYILKPMQSGFFGSSLDVLLQRLQVSDLILTGLTTDQCVALTANDAYLRGYSLYVPRNCCAAAKPTYHNQAIAQMGRILKADTRPWQTV